MTNAKRGVTARALEQFGDSMKFSNAPSEYANHVSALVQQMQTLQISERASVTPQMVSIMYHLKMQELTYQEIADKLGISRALVDYWLNHDRKLLAVNKHNHKCPRCHTPSYTRNQAGYNECSTCGYCPAMFGTDGVLK